MTEDIVPDSVLGRLLEELSWAGKTIKDYRRHGRGFENVLTAEVLAALDFLPRAAFLREVLRAAYGADAARAAVAAEIEAAEVTLLPQEFVIPAHGAERSGGIVVQPDGIISSDSCFTLVEAKRIRTTSFQPEQLSREYIEQ